MKRLFSETVLDSVIRILRHSKRLPLLRQPLPQPAWPAAGLSSTMSRPLAFAQARRAAVQASGMEMPRASCTRDGRTEPFSPYASSGERPQQSAVGHERRPMAGLQGGSSHPCGSHSRQFPPLQSPRSSPAEAGRKPSPSTGPLDHWTSINWSRSATVSPAERARVRSAGVLQQPVPPAHRKACAAGASPPRSECRRRPGALRARWPPDRWLP